jgi:hypothetical protein
MDQVRDAYRLVSQYDRDRKKGIVYTAAKLKKVRAARNLIRKKQRQLKLEGTVMLWFVVSVLSDHGPRMREDTRYVEARSISDAIVLAAAIRGWSANYKLIATRVDDPRIVAAAQEGTPSDNRMKFCYYCGGKLVETHDPGSDQPD